LTGEPEPEQSDADLFVSSLTVAELQRGILGEVGRKEAQGTGVLVFRAEGPQALFAGGVLPFDEKAALVWARLMAEDAANGQPRTPLDMIVAAVAEANNCVVVTENEKDFAGMKIVDPLRSA
jgi:predicted nucleic acid-binding protein